MTTKTNGRATLQQQVQTLRRPRLSAAICLASLLLAILPIAATGCAGPAVQNASQGVLQEIREEIIPEMGDPTGYGLPISLNNTQRFIDYHDSITLTPEQETVKRDALSSLKAPCCDDNSMYTC
ncbi:MAG: hypothetical protein JSW37_05965 [Anaerolineales bacterium]|nr:MAG: hypothetical protein JSW37_05965 [Anaerolineales bacterium]